MRTHTVGKPAFISEDTVQQKLTVRDDNHVRYTDKPWIRESIAILGITDYDGSKETTPTPWTQIDFEIIHPEDKRGNRKSVVHSICLTEGEREALIKMLTR